MQPLNRTSFLQSDLPLLPFLYTTSLQHYCFAAAYPLYNYFPLIRPQINQDYPLNLSILISGGKETKKDTLSNGEWRGWSSNL